MICTQQFYSYNTEYTINSLKKISPQRPEQSLVKEDRQMASQQMKRFCISYAIKEMQIKIFSYLLGWPESYTLTIANAGLDLE